VMKGDGAKGYNGDSKGHSTDSKGQGSDKFDVIVLTGSVPLIADAFFNQLNVGGRLFAIVGQAPVMTARLYTKAANNEVSHEDLFETVVAPLAGAPAPSRFKF
jgi:protein-L-isoaspartate(D-aspartate) O-methyltransferase